MVNVQAGYRRTLIHQRFLPPPNHVVLCIYTAKVCWLDGWAGNSHFPFPSPVVCGGNFMQRWVSVICSACLSPLSPPVRQPRALTHQRYHKKYARVGRYIPQTNTRMICCGHACTGTKLLMLIKFLYLF